MDILYVEDDLKTQEQTARFLRQCGHQVTVYDNIHDAFEHVIHHAPDLLLCDYRLGAGTNGLTLAGQVRNRYPTCSIVMVSNYTTAENVIDAMRLGLDDYIQRPIPLQDLYHRLLDVVTRRRQQSPSAEARLIVGALELDRSRRVAQWQGEPLNLSPTEFAILVHLVTHAGKVVTAIDLCALAKGERLDLERAGDLLKQPIFKLRAKLSQEGKYPQPIENVRGVGYRWVISQEG